VSIQLLVRVELSDLQKDYYRLYLTQNFELLRKKFKAASSIYNMIMQLKKVARDTCYTCMYKLRGIGSHQPWVKQE
jgi:SNF2 family DNA or RNA helicase